MLRIKIESKTLSTKSGTNLVESTETRHDFLISESYKINSYELESLIYNIYTG